MLTKDIRKTIDNARDVLVGKIPNPQSQIEQITIAMIYKFMDDMDLEAVEFGGERQFFTGELEEFAWSKLMSPQLGAEARMNLYTEALDKLPLEQSIPKLFRDIFKGAYLPFRDAQTLNLFLKEINDLSYDNSENLGNAFEYLLSIMGSQGDAGQFRTPRHIIDFIVDVVKPTKNDTILDPACGTAGFLISAYKHIVETARNNKQLLSPKELNALTENIQGYDISPDMVKLALVNMYLHKFKEPKIYEYDTLTKLDRWDNYFDCILANPPFMTPKGGIQPHNRFGVKANRSEVLFVDYIMEHLNSTGRAGIIVPEGIVFQSANAYKELRKKLVEENILYAVVSLPSGVFQPYSGVKTSILLLDRQLAKKTDKILFVEIQNDGFDLGAQRREIDKNDLPEAIEIINQWQYVIASGNEAIQLNRHSEVLTEESLTKSKLVTIVEKSKLAESGEYNLTASRYKVTQDFSNCKWNMVKLEDVCDLITCGVAKRPEYVREGIPFLSAKNVKNGQIIFDDFNCITPETYKTLTKYNKPEKGDILYTRVGSFGEAAVIETQQEFAVFVSLTHIKPKKDLISPYYLKYVLNSEHIKEIAKNCITGIGVGNLNVSSVRNFEIPLPPLEVQEEIVKELDGYQAVIDGAQKVIDNWKPTLPINPNWEKVKLGEVCKTSSGGTPLTTKEEYYTPAEIPWINSGEVKNGEIKSAIKYISKLGMEKSSAKLMPKETVLVAMYGATAGQVGILKIEATTNQALCCILPNDIFVPKFLYYILRQETNYLLTLCVGGAQSNISQATIKSLKLPVPSIVEQQEIVSKLEEEEKAIEECKKLIEIHKQKINDKIQSIWGNE